MSTPGQSRVAVPTFGGYAAPKGLVGVSFWPRFAARVIDTVVHVVTVFCAALVFSIGLAIVATLAGQPWQPLMDKLGSSTISGFVLGLLGAMSYQTLCEGLAGTSLGKRILGLVVVMEDGSPCRMRPALIRSAAYYIDTLALGVVAYMSIGSSPLRQRHGDGWAHTLVVQRSALPPERLRSGGRFVLALSLGVLADAVAIFVSLLLRLI